MCVIYKGQSEHEHWLYEGKQLCRYVASQGSHARVAQFSS